jgi:hypothetical protein
MNAPVDQSLRRGSGQGKVQTLPQDSAGPYLYCLIRSQTPREFLTKGMGERGDRVHTVHYREMAAVVSDSPLAEYESNRRHMLAHTAVLEEAMKSFSILPVRFNTVGPDEAAVCERLLRRRYGELLGLLDEMEGKVEMGLKALWYEGVAFQEIVEQNPDIRRLRDALQGQPPEKTHFDRVRLGEMVEAALYRKRNEEAEALLARLRPIVSRTRTNKEITDRMIVNAAFLVTREREDELDWAVQEFDRGMGKRVLFKYVGPAPPYNFVNVVVSWEEG